MSQDKLVAEMLSMRNVYEAKIEFLNHDLLLKKENLKYQRKFVVSSREENRKLKQKLEKLKILTLKTMNKNRTLRTRIDSLEAQIEVATQALDRQNLRF
tara:strand:- start:2982 stop:3278 length:297 start_codon:yes stop_codon:yes gene_type:complete